MVIVIEKEDSESSVHEKLAQANRLMKTVAAEDILALCGVLKGKLKDEPVNLIRKMRDEEWS